MKALTSRRGAPERPIARSRRPDRATRSEPTIYAVAERAGVSIATVSRVLRGTAPVAEPTRTRVLAAVESLGYRPSRSARSLAEGQHAANGIVFPDLSGPYFAEVVLGYEEVVAELGRSVLILSTHGRAAAREMVLDLAARVDGMVVLGRTVDDSVLLEVAARGRPVVALARAPVDGVDSVSAENTEAARRLSAHLVSEHGVRRIAFLGDAASSRDTSERWEGFRRGLAEHGIAAPRAPVACRFDEASGHEAAARLLAGRARPQALVCANDEIALGAITAAEEAGLRVPDDVAVTGWDDVMAARHARPGLTTVRQPMRELGAWAAHRLDARLRGDTGPARHEVMPTQLVVRGSCGHHTTTPMQEERP